MRGIAYAVAAIAAVGIMVGIVSLPSTPSGPESDIPTGDVATVSAKPMEQAGTLTLEVPEMHCPFACYPRVKETLEGTEAVEMVELAPQKEEGVIDNRQVIVKYDAGFDLAGALAVLKKEGFTDSQVVQ